MKNLLYTVVITVLSTTILISQSIEKSFELNGDVTSFEIDNDYADLEINYIDAPNLIVTGYATLNGFPVNDLVDVAWDNQKNRLVLSVQVEDKMDLLREKQSEFLKEIDCDSSTLEKLKNWIGDSDDRHNYNFDIDLHVEIPSHVKKLLIRSTYGSVNIENAPENLEINNVYGAIEVSINDQIRHCKLESTYNSVELMLPPQSDYNVTLESHYGEIFTNLDFPVDKNASISEQFRSVIRGKLNNGENTLTLKSNYNNIYLRGS